MAAAEAERLRAAAPQAAEVAVARRHGRRTSSSAAFLPATRPPPVVFTVGNRHRWGLPAAARMARRERGGAHTWRTSASGTIEFVAQPGKPLAQPGQWRIYPRRFRADPGAAVAAPRPIQYDPRASG